MDFQSVESEISLDFYFDPKGKMWYVKLKVKGSILLKMLNNYVLWELKSIALKFIRSMSLKVWQTGDNFKRHETLLGCLCLCVRRVLKLPF